MKALVWHGTNDVRVERVPDPKILNGRDAIVQDHDDGDLRLRSAPAQRLHPDDADRRHSRPRVHGRSGRGRQGEQEAEGRRSRRRAVHDRLRRLLLLQQAAVVAVRQLEPERVDGREALRLHDVGPVRLFAHDRRLRRRPGAVRARAVRRRRAAQDSRRHSATRRCCSSRTSCRPATWRPRTATSSAATRSRCGAAARSGRWRSGARFCSAPSG